MPAGMGNAGRLSEAVSAGGMAGVSQSRSLLNWQRVHVGAEQHGRSFAVAQQTDHTGSADAGRDLISMPLQPCGSDPRRSTFRHRKLGVGVNVFVDLFQFGQQGIRGSE